MMRWLSTAVFAISLALSTAAGAQQAPSPEENEAIARGFYEDLWFNNRTENYASYVADTYVVHDIGDRKGVTEPASEQQAIADFFWRNGEMSGEIDYQIAQDDLVATRWIWRYEPRTLFGHVFLGRTEIPIINVFRIQDGRIVEIWNHRHDIDTRMTLPIWLQGFGVGLIIALALGVYAIILHRRIARLRRA